MTRPKSFHIITVVGARPQFIKAAALSRAIDKSDLLVETLVHSGQHYDYNLSEGFFAELDIPKPQFNLEIGSLPHNKMIGEFLIQFDDILTKESPDLVVVFGDTNTTAAAAIATSKRNIPLAHVEAGLREWDKSIPEEINKLITDSVTDLYFSPTTTGVQNLKLSGVTKNVFLTGDISLDLLYQNTRYISETELKTKYKIGDKYAFMTCHRDANISDQNQLENILNSAADAPMPVIFPIHPGTKAAIRRYRLDHLLNNNIIATDPLGFWETQSLIKYADVVITDSGGIIKESYFHQVPGIIIDKQTEWIESVNEGWNVITGPDYTKIMYQLNHFKKPTRHSNALGDGKAGERIVNEIINYLNSKQ